VRYHVGRAELSRDGEPIRLTATEVHLMRILSDNLRQPVSRARLVEDLGRDEGHAQERAVDVQITRLRRKIEADPKQPHYLQTVRGEGYMLSPD
jgi:two-component system phosphate regulon response regulator OmpR